MTTRGELLNLISGGGGGGGGGGVPIYFASTHGVYDLQVESVESIVVPPNTYIFEAASIGEATLTTIDEPLWDMIQNRREFAAYLSSDPSAKEEQKKQVFKNLVYYKPGDTIYKRTLILEPENEFNPQWSYYKFTDGSTILPFPEAPVEEEGNPIIIPPEIPNPPFTDVMKSFRHEHFPVGKTRLRGFERVDTGSDIRFFTEVRKRDHYNGPAIFIFSSCASFWSSDDKKKDNRLILDIGRIQQLANQQFAEMGFTSGAISGEAGKPVLLDTGHRIPIKRRAKGTSMNEQFAATSKMVGNLKMTEVDAEELKYLDMVGEEITRFVRPRFNPIRVPPGAASIFEKLGEDRYNVSLSPTGKTWWTYEQMETAIDKGQQIYVCIGSNFIQLKNKAGMYTGAIRQHRAPNPKYPGSNWTKGGSRRFLKKSKKTRKTRKFKKSL